MKSVLVAKVFLVSIILFSCINTTHGQSMEELIDKYLEHDAAGNIDSSIFYLQELKVLF